VDLARGRWWFTLTALAVAVAIAIQVPVSAGSTRGFFDTPLVRALNVFAFFTVLSNLIVGATSLLLALDPRRPSLSFDVLRLTGVVAIAITGVVYHAVLRGLDDLVGWALVADLILHTLVPVMAVVGWLVWGPRDRANRRVVGLTVVFPVCWFMFTIIRGEVVGFYPYPFIDVADLGYARVMLNCVVVAALYLAVGAGAAWLDTTLIRARPRS